MGLSIVGVVSQLDVLFGVIASGLLYLGSSLSQKVMYLIASLLFSLALAREDSFEDSSERREKFTFTEYDDDFARQIMFPISTAAYGFNALHIESCLNRTIGDGTGIYQYSHSCQNGECSGFVAKLPRYRAIIIGFRGTQVPGQLIQQSIDSVLKPWSRWDYGGHISLYFHRAFHMIWQGLEGRVYTYIYEHPDWDIWIGGHSLGGALATLAAFFLVHSRLVQPDAVKLMTFGQPRVGDKAFADAFDDEVDYAYRVVHLRDMVPSILRSGYWHQGAEVIDVFICIFIR
ncbi:hypothetical protein Y032_0019g3784 [Ancylostoma ceylanicum]|uniref:Fungal lipase-type domain-containing protein n=1 Tax=Ancylostoma ceylanicum TaxID=53326 RepID=A0A016V1N3_9BILA|nr:hypothetical protein Y032_0019g3784 [Ancylostoma ceylanicum]